MRKKKPIIWLLAVLGVFFLFSPTVSAHEGHEGHNGGSGEITVSEKNKLIAGLLKSEEFKEEKKELKSLGYHWNGVNGTELDYNEELDEYLIAIPLLTPDRTEEHFLLYALGEFRGPFPKDF